MAEDPAGVGGLVVQFAGEVLAGEMLSFVQAAARFAGEERAVRVPEPAAV